MCRLKSDRVGSNYSVLVPSNDFYPYFTPSKPSGSTRSQKFRKIAILGPKITYYRKDLVSGPKSYRIMSNCSVLVPSNNSYPFFTNSKPLKATRSQYNLKKAILGPTNDLIGPLEPSVQT